MNAQAFLRQVLAIEAEKPRYKLGGSGKNGICDCIGLVIGALRRAGGKWTGIHGSNWAARNEVDDLRWTSTSELHPGEVVFKAHKPGESGYNLPARYAGDVDDNDYYHVGVVYSVNPLVIIHCTGPGVIRDKKIGKWKYVARLKQVTPGGNVADHQDDKNDSKPEVQTDKQPESVTILWHGRVKTSKGRGISLWDSCAKKWARKRVPDGAVVDVIGEADNKGFVLAKYKGVQGMADTRYLVRVNDSNDGASSNELNTHKKGEKFKAIVVSWSVNVRNAPSKTNGKIMYVVRKGDVLDIVGIDESTGWYHLADNNYICSDYLKRI